MNHFCVAKITTEPLLRAEHGLLRADAMTLTGDARVAAEHILQHAMHQAEQLRLDGADAAEAAVRQAERQALERCAVLLRALEQRHAQLLLGAQDIVVDLALALFERALAETTPRERLTASCRRLLRETPRALTQPVLYLHPEDEALAPSEPAWERRTDATLPRGACRLEAGGGEWRADFAEGAAALRDAFAAAARPAIADEPHTES